MAECNSCGATIFWVIMPSGKRMPLDAKPDPNGKVVLHDDGKHAFAPGAGGDEPAMRFPSHFATCPHAANHRKHG